MLMSEDLLIRHCSPTLAGIKTGLPLQEGTDKICIQVKQKTGAQGNPYSAAQGLSGPRPDLCLPPSCVREWPYGSSGQGAAAALRLHAGKSQCLCDTPDQPSPAPKDVLGFIVNRACNHKCQGCWKVYGDEQESKSIFEKYDLCSKIYFQQWKQGKSIEQLTVAGWCFHYKNRKEDLSYE